MVNKIILLCIVVIGAIGSVAFFFLVLDRESGGNDSSSDSSSTETIEITSKEPFISYDIVLDAVWDEKNHTNIPDGAHFSPFVAWTHKEGVKVFEVGDQASEGIRLMAETGGTEILKQELDELREKGMIGEYVIGELIFSPDTVRREIAVDQDFRYLSFVSMIAPSPDWFVAVKDINLFRNREWQQEENIPLVVYDAGTDSGETFTAANKKTEPQGVIHSLLEDEIDVEEGGGTIAHLKITRQED